MKIAMTGSSGLIGTALVQHLRAGGAQVTRIVRKPAVGPAEISWDPSAGIIDASRLEGMDAVVHLAGAGVGDHRWTDAYKQQILDSRVLSTRTLVDALCSLEAKPAVLISASAIGWYGDTGATPVDESAPAGNGFLADVVCQWEAASQPAAAVGIRVVNPRTGLVVSSKGGAWARMFPLFKAGLGGKLGNGRQYWSWISLRDEVAALQFAIDHDGLSGPVNFTGPQPVTNAEVTKAMGAILHRPTLLPAPAAALKAALGEFSIEVLGSARVMPAKLQQAGFAFQDTTISAAIETALAER